MDVLTLSSSLNISKPFNFLPLSKNHQKHPRTQFSVSCVATKQHGGVDENLYSILSLSPNSASMDDIKKAYRSMALRYHPDVCRDGSKKEEQTRMFVQLNAAYETLSNPRLREEYDYELGLRSKMSVGDESWRIRWREQVSELKRRSRKRVARKEASSWASRIRVQNMK
ncbi:chaperone protein dnaJ 20, chloroplastic [Cajanus cajan]|uniref:J domain-containing protein n=1 Tax=Cajanus cajan TaxID=3821 RepID=A0A151T0F8_CAJCA|nr:chaperone protein dnaJ 20, chloroplastic [Cajanus cajan]KYP60544.1 hypothetical protein KK1_022951 [Cajanus cajan]